MRDLDAPVEDDAYIVFLKLWQWRRGRLHVYSHICDSKKMKMTSFDIQLENALLSMFVRFGNLDYAWYLVCVWENGG